MIRLVVAIVLLGAFGIPAFSQTAVIRSGEHDGFSRLVLPLPVDATWSINRSGRSFSLIIDEPEIQFDLSRIFDRIPRSRLVSVAQKNPGAELVFSLGCACRVSNFMDTPGFLVIDIADQVSTSPTRPETLGMAIKQARYRLSSQTPSADWQVPGSLPLPGMIGQVLEYQPSTESPAPSIDWSNRPPSAINLSERRLLAQISRASDQGLLELTSEPKPNENAMRADGTETRDGDTVNEVQELPLSVSLSVTTAIDRDLAVITDRLGQSSSEPECLDSERVGLSDWGGDQPFAADVGGWRAQLFGEFDTLNSQATLGLVRAYLYYGFGAEAEQVMGLGSAPSEDSRVLKALAKLMDAGDALEDNPFAGQQNCKTDVALWSVLAADVAPEDTNTQSVLRAFSRLPPHLRSYLGPKVSQRFSGAGNSQAAESILRAIDRSGEESGTEIEMARAAVAALRGDTEIVVQELTKSVVAGSEYSPEALVKLVANWFDSREVLAPDLPDLAAAYASEFRNTEMGADLRRTHVVTLALAGQFGEAFALLPDLAERDGEPDKQKALEPLLHLLSERADDVAFLRFGLSAASDSPAKVPDQVGDKMARRLLDLGFPDKASYWVQTPEGSVNSDTRRKMRAEIALARQRPHRALVELVGLTDAQATSLRAAATLEIGDYTQAGQMLNAVGDFEGAARGFWLGEEWETGAEQDNTVYAQIIASSVQLRSDDSESDLLPPLAQARALMQVSTGARAQIATLLQKLPVE